MLASIRILESFRLVCTDIVRLPLDILDVACGHQVPTLLYELILNLA